MNVPSKIPTIAGLLLVVASVGVVVFVVERALRSPSGAAGSQEPKNLEVSNVSDTSFTVSWMTGEKATGTLLVSSPSKTNRIYYDERDTTGKLGAYSSHSVTVRDAQAATTYSFKVLSNGRQYTNAGKPFEITTPQSLSPNTNGLDPAYGKIITARGEPAEGALVYLTLEGGQKLSSLTKPSGIFLIPLNQVRTEDLTTFLPTVERMDETLLVRHSTGDITATTDTLNDSPVPDMTIPGTFDFRRQNAKTTTNNALALRATTPAAAVAQQTGATVLGETTVKPAGVVTLVSPAQNAYLTATLPLITGTGIPNKFIAISLGITRPISGSTQVKADGTWSYTPPKPLAPGKQSVTITTVDANNKPVAITHLFEIFKSGTQVLGVATGSATLTPTFTPTPTTLVSSTDSPTPTEVSTLSGNEMPTSGNELPTLMLLMIGLGLFMAGATALVL